MRLYDIKLVRWAAGLVGANFVRVKCKGADGAIYRVRYPSGIPTIYLRRGGRLLYPDGVVHNTDLTYEYI